MIWRMHALRQRAGDWVESSPIQKFIIAVIVANAVTLGLETSDSAMDRAGGLIHTLDAIFLGIFVVELGLKLFAHGWRFFTDPWNVFDFLIVAIALVPASGPFAVLRALRVLRVLRLISVMPRLRFIVEALLAAMPGIGAIGLLLVLIFYVASVMATSLFGDTFPEWFGSIGDSLYTLFQVMTLESWSMGIVRPVMEVHPWAWAFFVTFILLSSFTILNLFIAVIVDTMQTLHDRDRTEDAAAAAAGDPDAETPPPAHGHPVALATSAATDEILGEIRRLHARLDELEAGVDGAVSREGDPRPAP